MVSIDGAGNLGPEAGKDRFEPAEKKHVVVCADTAEDTGIRTKVVSEIDELKAGIEQFDEPEVSSVEEMDGWKLIAVGEDCAFDLHVL